MNIVYTTESEYDLGITNLVFTSSDLAQAHAKKAFASSGLLEDFESFEEYKECGLFRVMKHTVISEEP